MKTKARPTGAPMRRIQGKRITVKGKRMVMLEEAEFDRLLVQADQFEPLLPEPDADGNYPIEVLRIDLAIRIIRHRRKAGLTQAELARLAGIRSESLNRIEQGNVAPSIRTLEKIDRVLNELVEEYDEPTPKRRRQAL
jgi:DNA-binding XRE family transcriptional regulator